MRFDLPQPVLAALEKLNQNGHRALIVGGCVRDMLRGIVPHDYDICTSALPQQTHACFAGERVIDTGLKHGTVTVLLGGMPLEITTFRADGQYLDGRHPQSVSFTSDLAEDLKRRDFTVNAMAYHPNEGLYDLFDGQGDLRRGVIRCVGDARTRLTEDALRILRAVRFAAQLSFAIEPATAAVMRELRGRLALVSRERVADELLHTVQAAGAAEVLRNYSDILLAALPDFAPQALAEGLAALGRLPAGDTVLRMAALLHACGAAERARCVASLHPSRAFTADVLALCDGVQQAFPLQDTALALSRLGEAQLRRLLLLQQACDILTAQEAAAREARMQATLAQGLPLRVRDLPISGEDLLALGFEGRQIGEALERLHQRVLRGELPCEREALLAEMVRVTRSYDTGCSFL